MNDTTPAVVRRDLDALSTHADASAQRALADLGTLAAATAQARNSLSEALRQARRAAWLADYDQAALQEFLEKPYRLERVSGDAWRLIVPRFFGFRGGWLDHHEGAYSVFIVNRFAHIVNPLPDWLTAELGFGAPAFQALIDGNVLTVTDGDPAVAAGRLGKAVARREGRQLYLKASSRMDVIRRLIRDEGILPFAPRPIAQELWRESQVVRDEQGRPAFELREHQTRDYVRFLELGAVLIVAYPQTGKTFVALKAMADLAGRKLVLCPRRSLVEQWKARIALYLTPQAAAEIAVTTYQGAGKYLNQDWTLVVFDEAHRTPADFAIETATSIRAVARMGLSATPFREDGQHDLMPMLCGFPLGADWPVSAIQRPDVTVWIVPGETAKIKLAQRLCEEPVSGKTFVYVQRLAIGEKVAKALDAPFVSGKTKKQLGVIQDNDVVVLSSVGDEGLSAGVARVVEVDFLFGSRMQAGQRLGRLADETGKRQAGEHHVLMTPQEYSAYGKRLLAYESWGLRIDIRVPEGDVVPIVRSKVKPIARTRRPAQSPGAAGSGQAEPTDEISQVLAVPAIAAKISKAKTDVGRRTAPYVQRAFRLCYSAAFKPEEIAEGLGIQDAATVSRFRSACKALLKAGLFVGVAGEDGVARFKVSQDEVNRLRALAGAVRK